MADARFLDQAELWSTLKAEAAKRGSRLIASAFVGSGASRFLPLRKGDVLLCALSIPNCRAGLVAPNELKALQRKGVRVYRSDDLHAKVFLLPRCCIVGSNNLSLTSQTRLDEAAVLIRDKSFRDRVSDWFASRIGVEVSPDFLMECAAAYRPPKRVGLHASPKPGVMPATWVLWGVADEAHTSDEQLVLSRARKEAKRRIENMRGFVQESLVWPGSRVANEMRAGDTLIYVYDDERGTPVKSLGECLTVRQIQGSNPRAVVWAAWPQRRKSIPWIKFLTGCQRNGVPMSAVTKRYTNRSHRQVLHGLASGTLRVARNRQRPR